MDDDHSDNASQLSQDDDEMEFRISSAVTFSAILRLYRNCPAFNGRGIYWSTWGKLTTNPKLLATSCSALIHFLTRVIQQW